MIGNSQIVIPAEPPKKDDAKKKQGFGQSRTTVQKNIGGAGGVLFRAPFRQAPGATSKAYPNL